MESKEAPVFTRQQSWVIVCLIIGACLPLVDATILGVAVPSLAHSFKADIAKLQWVSILYTLVATVTVTVCAWATRKWGAKRLWLWGLGIFTLSSLFAGLSSTIETLLLSRALQGIGAGIIMTGMQTVLVYSVGKPLLKTAMATMAVPTVLAPIVGPVLAGYLLEVANWRWIFYINVPIGLLAMCLSLIKIKRDSLQESKAFDVIGFTYLATALLLLVWSFSSLAQTDYSRDNALVMSLGACLLGAILLVRFIKHMRREEKGALIRLQPFCERSFQSAIGLLFLASIGFYAGLFALPILFIQGLLQSEWVTSLLIGAHGAGALVARPYLKALCERIGVGNTALIAILLSMIGTAPMLLPSIGSLPVVLAVLMFARGAGMGLLTLLAMSHVYHDVEAEYVADASVLSRIATLLGASFGPALVALLYSLDSGIISTQAVLVGLVILTLLCIIPTWYLLKLDRALCNRVS